ncbi:hypothetical protein [Conexibacter sp. SYSU D00693]|uniref:hypothetical protein n=1 Tax=Conexibacter sp. SYSU D00693 TaxID=2812560 RepID=UPI00196B7650|nr:hypothetical protein [Conexibacter sp. SYSU D00693]
MAAVTIFAAGPDLAPLPAEPDPVEPPVATAPDLEPAPVVVELPRMPDGWSAATSALVKRAAPRRTTRPRSAGDVPALAGTEVRDSDGIPVGHVLALRFDELTRCPSELEVELAPGITATVPAFGLRMRIDHVQLSLTATMALSPSATAAAWS